MRTEDGRRERKMEGRNERSEEWIIKRQWRAKNWYEGGGWKDSFVHS